MPPVVGAVGRVPVQRCQQVVRDADDVVLGHAVERACHRRPDRAGPSSGCGVPAAPVRLRLRLRVEQSDDSLGHEYPRVDPERETSPQEVEEGPRRALTERSAPGQRGRGEELRAGAVRGRQDVDELDDVGRATAGDGTARLEVGDAEASEEGGLLLGVEGVVARNYGQSCRLENCTATMTKCAEW